LLVDAEVHQRRHRLGACAAGGSHQHRSALRSRVEIKESARRRLARKLAGDAVELAKARLVADVRHEGAHHAIGVGDDDVGAGGDELLVQGLHDIGRLDQRATRPERRARLAQSAGGDRLAHAAIEQQGTVGGQVDGGNGHGRPLRSGSVGGVTIPTVDAA